MKKLFSRLIIPVVLLLLPGLSSAAQFHSGGEYTLQKNQTIQENLYVAGGTVTILGDVQGDVVVAGGQVVISGNVRDDVLAAGGTVTIEGSVGGDVRVAGGQINIQGSVAHDLLASGGSVMIGPGASVEGDTLLSGGQIDIKGTINHPLSVAGGTIILNGVVNGDVTARGGDVKLGSQANVQGNFSYYSPTQASVDSGARISGKTSYHKIETQSWFAGMFSLFWFARLLMALTLGLIVFYLFGRQAATVVRSSFANVGGSILHGLLALFVAPLAIVVLCVTIIGIPLGIMGIFAYITFIFFSHIYSGILFGSFIFKFASSGSQAKDYAVTWQSVVLGIILLNIIGFVPFAGWLVRAAFFLIALGTLSNLTYRRFRNLIS